MWFSQLSFALLAAVCQGFRLRDKQDGPANARESYLGLRAKIPNACCRAGWSECVDQAVVVANEDLRLCMKDFNSEEPVAVTIFDRNYKDLYPMWDERAVSLGASQRVAVVMDVEALATARNLTHGPCVVRYFDACDGGGQAKLERGMNRTMTLHPFTGLAKFDVVTRLVEGGFTTYVSELDVFWFESPVNLFKKYPQPLVIQTPSGPGVGKFNIGFFRVRPEPGQVRFWRNLTDAWKEQIRTSSGDGKNLCNDQRFFSSCFQTMFTDTNDVVMLLPHTEAAITITRPAGKTCQAGSDAVVFHAVALNLKQKLAILRLLYSGRIKRQDFMKKFNSSCDSMLAFGQKLSS